MLSSYVGEDRFMKGVSLYLKKHQFGNTVTEDLWEGMKAGTGQRAFLSCRTHADNVYESLTKTFYRP